MQTDGRSKAAPLMPGVMWQVLGKLQQFETVAKQPLKN